MSLSLNLQQDNPNVYSWPCNKYSKVRKWLAAQGLETSGLTKLIVVDKDPDIKGIRKEFEDRITRHNQPAAGILQLPVAALIEDSPSWSPASLTSYWSALPSPSDWEWCPPSPETSAEGRWRSPTPRETSSLEPELESLT